VESLLPIMTAQLSVKRLLRLAQTPNLEKNGMRNHPVFCWRIYGSC